MQADTAVVPEIIENEFPFSDLKGKANVLVFPDLNSGNIAYKLMARIGQATVIGPVLMGMKKPIHVLQRGATVDDIHFGRISLILQIIRKVNFPLIWIKLYLTNMYLNF